MNYPGRTHFGKRAPTKAQLRTALRSVLVMRRHGKPPTDADFASYERCYGVPEQDARAMWGELCEVRG